MRHILKIKDAILDILFPPVCLHCDGNLSPEEKSSLLCIACASKISIHTTLFCAGCRARLPENRKVCHKDAFYMLGAAVNYDGPVKDVIHQLKYRRWTSLIKVIRPIMNEYIENLALSVDGYIVIPIPLHPDRLKERGFNQAELIGSVISEKLGLPMRTDLLMRAKETKAQAEIKNYADRALNLEDAFKAGYPEGLNGKNIILVDDVYTSGATINDAVRALREAGAKKIIAFTFAKTR